MVPAGNSASETEGKPGRRNREGTEPKAPAGTARGQSAIQEAEEQRTHSQNVQTPRGALPPRTGVVTRQVPTAAGLRSAINRGASSLPL